MSGLMSAVAGGLSAAGYAGGDLYGKGALMDQQSALDLDKAQRLAQFKEMLDQRSEDRKNAPLLRLAGNAQKLAGEDVPQEASAVTRLTGAGAPNLESGVQSSGLQGDPGKIRAQIMAWPEGTDRTNALAQLDKQFAAEADKNVAAVAGKTRKRTADEAFDAALSDAKLKDPLAYAAGKPLATEKTITIPDGATVIDRNGKVIFSGASTKDARQNAHEDRLDARARESQASAAALAREAEDGRDRRASRATAEAEARATGRAPAGYRWKEDRSGLEFIPGGPADPAVKPAGGKPLTDSQAKALLFGVRMQASDDILTDLQSKGKAFSTPGASAGYGVGATVNVFNSKEGQMLDQAKRDFLNAVLRRESGAVISPEEFANGDIQYFPRAGDAKEVIEQKNRNRALATKGILAEVPDWEGRVAELRSDEKPSRAKGDEKPKAGGATGGWGITEIKR